MSYTEDDIEDLELTKDFKQTGWQTPDNEIFFANVSLQRKELEPGLYDIIYNRSLGYILKRCELQTQNYITFPDSVADLVINDITKFWLREEKFRTHKFPYKRGILMYGPPGCGKSCTIALICNDIIHNQRGIILKYSDNHTFASGLEMVRKVQPTVPVIALMEDLDQIIHNDNISNLLNMLDGVEKVVDKVVFLATTNHPESFPDNLKNRPSRFDRRVKFNSPTDQTRTIYLESLFKQGGSVPDLTAWIKETEGFSFAHLKELFVSVELLGNEFSEVIQELRQMHGAVSGSDDNKIDLSYDEDDDDYDDELDSGNV